MNYYSLLNSQNESKIWHFGFYTGLDFNSSPPSPITTGSMNAGEGCASICDNTGNLLFYTDGMFVRNSTHAMMANGTGLAGNGTSTQSGMIVQLPGSTNIYYIFTIWGNANYSIVDMNLAAGLGSVTVKNANIYSSTCENQVAIRHCNGKDVWIVSHEYNSNNFRAYLLTSAGLSATPVISACGGTLTGDIGSAIGQLKVSPDGKKIAMAVFRDSNPSSACKSGFYLFDFDAASGIISNSVTLNNAMQAYGTEFSPDGSKLYGASSWGTGSVVTSSYLYQWNVCAGTPSAIAASQYSIGLGQIVAGSLQRAIDSKIYLAVSNQQSLCVINAPNLSGPSMSFSFNAINLSPKFSALGLPNFVNTYTKPSPQPFTNTVTCNQVNFSPPPIPTFSSGCSSTPYPPNGYLWDFGEPSSGTANSSSLSSPNHVYASVGTYTVKLVILNACTNDTLIQSVNITTLGPTPTVTGPTLICKGDRYNYSVSGGSTYLWSTGSTASVVALQPTQTTVYTVSATANGCTQSKTFTVTVNPCLGIEDLESAGIWRVYPNPVVNEIQIESAAEGTLKLFDLNGSLIFEFALQQGANTINISAVKAGVYNLQLSNPNFTSNLRMVKVE